MNKKGWIGKALLALAVVVPLVGFSVSVYVTRTGSEEPQVQDESLFVDGTYVLTAGDFPEPLDTGGQVGNRIPDFALELADGSTVTSEGLVLEGRPTYLFFWATI